MSYLLQLIDQHFLNKGGEYEKVISSFDLFFTRQDLLSGNVLNFFDYRKPGDSIAIESVREFNGALKKTQKKLDDSLEKIEKSFNESADKVTSSVNNFTDAVNNTTVIAKPIAWVATGIAGIFATYHIFSGIFYQFSDEAVVKRLKNKQERKLIVARQTLLNLLKNNVKGKIGRCGLPRVCDRALLDLVLLPGGKEELEKIIASFKQYVSTK
jgi:hypothetical protein